MTKEEMMRWKCLWKYFLYDIVIINFSHTAFTSPGEGDISRTFIFMPFHYWLCVMFWCAFFVCFVIFFMCPFPLENKWWRKYSWMQCQRKKKSFLLNFHLTLMTFQKKNWNLCVDIYSHADFHYTLLSPPFQCWKGKDIKHFILFIAAHAIK